MEDEGAAEKGEGSLGVSGGDKPPSKKKGRDPSTYNLVEAAQYGYLDR